MSKAAIALLFAAATASAQIPNIGRFLDQCPQNDPAFAQILTDFKIRRSGVLASVPPCTEPVSAMATADYTDVLIVLQGLRVIYYMDRGQHGHLPWTGGTLYEWMHSKIGGIDIVPGGSFCCEVFDAPPPIVPPPGSPPPPLEIPARYWYIAVGAQDDFNRDFDKRWRGIAGDIDLYAHETRHRDGFPHTSCCGIAGGCDQSFDTASLSPYGVQWWLNKLWLDGTINVGMDCLTPLEKQASVEWFASALNSQFSSRFCDARPAPAVLPPRPGGACSEPPPRRRAVRK